MDESDAPLDPTFPTATDQDPTAQQPPAIVQQMTPDPNQPPMTEPTLEDRQRNEMESQIEAEVQAAALWR